MKTYFQDKLTEVVKHIESTTNSIVREAQAGKFGSLADLTNRLEDISKKRSELTTDCIKYLSVAEVIEMASLKERYSDTPIVLFKTRDIEYGYKYNTSVTMQERDQLIAKFGSGLREAKVR